MGQGVGRDGVGIGDRGTEMRDDVCDYWKVGEIKTR